MSTVTDCPERIEDYLPLVRQVAKRRAPGLVADAEDLAQEALMRLHREWHTFDPELSLRTSWIARVAVAAMTDAVRAGATGTGVVRVAKGAYRAGARVQILPLKALTRYADGWGEEIDRPELTCTDPPRPTTAEEFDCEARAIIGRALTPKELVALRCVFLEGELLKEAGRRLGLSTSGASYLIAGLIDEARVNAGLPTCRSRANRKQYPQSQAKYRAKMLAAKLAATPHPCHVGA